VAASADADVVVRRFRAEDRPSLDALVAEGKDARAFAGSSDPDGGAFGFFAGLAPEQLAVAVRGRTLVGVISPEIKAAYVTPSERRHGLGRRLVDEADRIERGRGRAQVLLGTLPDDVAALAFLRATGFDHHSTLWDLRLSVGTTVPAPAWPDGLVTRAIRIPDDDPAFLELFNTAFADHATPLQMDASMLAPAETESLVGADVLVVEDPGAAGRLIAFCSTDPGRRPGDEPRAEIWTIGVRPEHRGQGLGRELLRWGVSYLRGIRGLPVTLSVNGRNAGALRLYEREGFVRTGTRDRWARPVAHDPAS
jgi:mycothiol synthase